VTVAVTLAGGGFIGMMLSAIRAVPLARMVFEQLCIADIA
jgi:hypothetical protein